MTIGFICLKRIQIYDTKHNGAYSGIWNCRVWGIRTAKTRRASWPHHFYAKSSSVLTHIIYIMKQNTVCLYVFMIYTWYTHACMHVHIHVYIWFSWFLSVCFGKCASTKSVHSGHFLKGATMEEWRKVMVEMVTQMTQARDTNILQTPFPGMLDLVCCWVVVLWN